MNNEQIARVNLTVRNLETGRIIRHVFIRADQVLKSFNSDVYEIVEIERIPTEELEAIAASCDRFGSN